MTFDEYLKHQDEYNAKDAEWTAFKLKFRPTFVVATDAQHESELTFIRDWHEDRCAGKFCRVNRNRWDAHWLFECESDAVMFKLLFADHMVEIV